MSEQHQCSKCGSISDEAPVIVTKDIIWYKPPDQQEYPDDCEMMAGGYFCSPTCFNAVWEWFYPAWLQRDRSRDE